MGVSGQGSITNITGEGENRTVTVEVNGQSITLKFDANTKLASGYIPTKGDVVKVEYGGTSLTLKSIQLVSRPAAQTEAQPEAQAEAEAPAEEAATE